MRLNAYLARQLGISRRNADDLIQKGYIEIDGEIASFTDQASEASKIRVYKNGTWDTISNSSKKQEAILFYKPIFSVVTKKDPQKRKTVYDILPKKYSHLGYAGRLDYMSEGLMVFSNNGELIHNLTHPSMSKIKIYLVALKYPLKKEQIKDIEKGLEIPDEETYEPVGISKTELGAQIMEKLPGYGSRTYDFLKFHKDHYVYAFHLTEGKKNEIRKICKYYGQDVLRLVRVEMGNYKLSFDLYKRKIIEL
ncbi:MAG: pseudouridine synthase [Patescibacteria group bacterium]